MSTYTPNFNDKRVITRCKSALGFALACFSYTKPHEWSTRYIDKHFGHSGNKLSGYLRDKLLVVVDDHYSFGDESKCKTYLLNKDGVDFVKSQIGLLGTQKNLINHTNTIPYCDTSFDLAIEWARNAYKEELVSFDFEYEEKSHRLFNPIQNIRSETRNHLLNRYGMNFTYDIVCAAPTLLYQYSRMIPYDKMNSKGLYEQGPNEEWMPTLEHYLRNRRMIRHLIAEEIDLEYKQVKQIINALFAGAKISSYKEGAIFILIDRDKEKIKLLQKHPYITALRVEIKKIWDYIKPTLPVRYSAKPTKTGKKRKLALSSKDKWDVYFQLERKVINEVNTYLTTSGNQCFLEHDGWSCVNEVNLYELQNRIYETTGFALDLEVNEIEREYD